MDGHQQLRQPPLMPLMPQMVAQPMQQVLPGPGILGYGIHGILGVVPTATGGADISCPICGKAFANRSKLINRHLNRPNAKVTQKMLDQHNLEQHGVPIPDRPPGSSLPTTNVQLFEGQHGDDDDDTQEPHPAGGPHQTEATEGPPPSASRLSMQADGDPGRLRELVKEAVREELAPLRQELATIRAGITQVLLLLNSRGAEPPFSAASAGPGQAPAAVARKRKAPNT